jgi:hypothetical protein
MQISNPTRGGFFHSIKSAEQMARLPRHKIGKMIVRTTFAGGYRR